jgi:hypothetical protein
MSATTLTIGSTINWNGNAVEYTGTGKCKYTGRTMAILKGQTPSWASEKPKEIYFQVEMEDAIRNLTTLK